jgi:protein-S-isoprenylcysteine O-methyltransferase Ste14
LLKSALFTLCVPGTFALWLPWALSRTRWGARSAALEPVATWGWLALAFGLAIYLRCVWDFAAAGGGTPLPLDPPKRFVARGLYRHTRHPMYWGVGLCVLGHALLRAAPNLFVYLALLACAFAAFVLGFEERDLRRRFGADYERYRNEVPLLFWRLDPWKAH